MPVEPIGVADNTGGGVGAAPNVATNGFDVSVVLNGVADGIGDGCGTALVSPCLFSTTVGGTTRATNMRDIYLPTNGGKKSFRQNKILT